VDEQLELELKKVVIEVPTPPPGMVVKLDDVALPCAPQVMISQDGGTAVTE